MKKLHIGESTYQTLWAIYKDAHENRLNCTHKKIHITLAERLVTLLEKEVELYAKTRKKT